MRPSWYPDWRRKTAIVIASGPSAATVPFERAAGRARAIAVNDSWQLYPESDILFAGDFAWWRENLGCPDFPGIKTSIDRRACEHPDWGVRRLQGNRGDNRIEFDDAGHIGGGNSGLNGLNLAVQLRPANILLVGFDMTLKYGLHWHGPHPENMKNPIAEKVERWRRCVDSAASPIAARGIRVINCSPVSALKRYEKMDFAKAIEATCRALA